MNEETESEGNVGLPKTLELIADGVCTHEAAELSLESRSCAANPKLLTSQCSSDRWALEWSNAEEKGVDLAECSDFDVDENPNTQGNKSSRRRDRFEPTRRGASHLTQLGQGQGKANAPSFLMLKIENDTRMQDVATSSAADPFPVVNIPRDNEAELACLSRFKELTNIEEQTSCEVGEARNSVDPSSNPSETELVVIVSKRESIEADCGSFSPQKFEVEAHLQSSSELSVALRPVDVTVPERMAAKHLLCMDHDAKFPEGSYDSGQNANKGTRIPHAVFSKDSDVHSTNNVSNAEMMETEELDKLIGCQQANVLEEQNEDVLGSLKEKFEKTALVLQNISSTHSSAVQGFSSAGSKAALMEALYEVNLAIQGLEMEKNELQSMIGGSQQKVSLLNLFRRALLLHDLILSQNEIGLDSTETRCLLCQSSSFDPKDAEKNCKAHPAVCSSCRQVFGPRVEQLAAILATQTSQNVAQSSKFIVFVGIAISVALKVVSNSLLSSLTRRTLNLTKHRSSGLKKFSKSTNPRSCIDSDAVDGSGGSTGHKEAGAKERQRISPVVMSLKISKFLKRQEVSAFTHILFHDNTLKEKQIQLQKYRVSCARLEEMDEESKCLLLRQWNALCRQRGVSEQKCLEGFTYDAIKLWSELPIYQGLLLQKNIDLEPFGYSQSTSPDEQVKHDRTTSPTFSRDVSATQLLNLFLNFDVGDKKIHSAVDLKVASSVTQSNFQQSTAFYDNLPILCLSVILELEGSDTLLEVIAEFVLRKMIIYCFAQLNQQPEEKKKEVNYQEVLSSIKKDILHCEGVGKKIKNAETCLMKKFSNRVRKLADQQGGKGKKTDLTKKSRKLAVSGGEFQTSFDTKARDLVKSPKKAIKIGEDEQFSDSTEDDDGKSRNEDNNNQPNTLANSNHSDTEVSSAFPSMWVPANSSILDSVVDKNRETQFEAVKLEIDALLGSCVATFKRTPAEKVYCGGGIGMLSALPDRPMRRSCEGSPVPPSIEWLPQGPRGLIWEKDSKNGDANKTQTDEDIQEMKCLSIVDDRIIISLNPKKLNPTLLELIDKSEDGLLCKIIKNKSDAVEGENQQEHHTQITSLSIGMRKEGLDVRRGVDSHHQFGRLKCTSMSFLASVCRPFSSESTSKSSLAAAAKSIQYLLPRHLEKNLPKTTRSTDSVVGQCDDELLVAYSIVLSFTDSMDTLALLPIPFQLTYDMLASNKVSEDSIALTLSALCPVSTFLQHLSMPSPKPPWLWEHGPSIQQYLTSHYVKTVIDFDYVSPERLVPKALFKRTTTTTTTHNNNKSIQGSPYSISSSSFFRSRDRQQMKPSEDYEKKEEGLSENTTLKGHSAAAVSFLRKGINTILDGTSEDKTYDNGDSNNKRSPVLKISPTDGENDSDDLYPSSVLVESKSLACSDLLTLAASPESADERYLADTLVEEQPVVDESPASHLSRALNKRRLSESESSKLMESVVGIGNDQLESTRTERYAKRRRTATSVHLNVWESAAGEAKAAVLHQADISQPEIASDVSVKSSHTPPRSPFDDPKKFVCVWDINRDPLKCRSPPPVSNRSDSAYSWMDYKGSDKAFRGSQRVGKIYRKMYVKKLSILRKSVNVGKELYKLWQRSLWYRDRKRLFCGDLFAWGILPVRALHNPTQWVPLPAGYLQGNRYSTANTSLDMSQFHIVGPHVDQQQQQQQRQFPPPPSPNLQRSGEVVSRSSVFESGQRPSAPPVVRRWELSASPKSEPPTRSKVSSFFLPISSRVEASHHRSFKTTSGVTEDHMKAGVVKTIKKQKTRRFSYFPNIIRSAAEMNSPCDEKSFHLVRLFGFLDRSYSVAETFEWNYFSEVLVEYPNLIPLYLVNPYPIIGSSYAVQLQLSEEKSKITEQAADINKAESRSCMIMRSQGRESINAFTASLPTIPSTMGGENVRHVIDTDILLSSSSAPMAKDTAKNHSKSQSQHHHATTSRDWMQSGYENISGPPPKWKHSSLFRMGQEIDFYFMSPLKGVYLNNNGLINATYSEDSDASVFWTEADIISFINKYTLHPKDFKRISGASGPNKVMGLAEVSKDSTVSPLDCRTKTEQHCTDFYYRFKYFFELKRTIRDLRPGKFSKFMVRRQKKSRTKQHIVSRLIGKLRRTCRELIHFNACLEQRRERRSITTTTGGSNERKDQDSNFKVRDLSEQNDVAFLFDEIYSLAKSSSSISSIFLDPRVLDTLSIQSYHVARCLSLPSSARNVYSVSTLQAISSFYTLKQIALSRSPARVIAKGNNLSLPPSKSHISLESPHEGYIIPLHVLGLLPAQKPLNVATSLSDMTSQTVNHLIVLTGDSSLTIQNVGQTEKKSIWESNSSKTEANPSLMNKSPNLASATKMKSQEELTNTKKVKARQASKLSVKRQVMWKDGAGSTILRRLSNLLTPARCRTRVESDSKLLLESLTTTSDSTTSTSVINDADGHISFSNPLTSTTDFIRQTTERADLPTEEFFHQRHSMAVGHIASLLDRVQKQTTNSIMLGRSSQIQSPVAIDLGGENCSISSSNSNVSNPLASSHASGESDCSTLARPQVLNSSAQNDTSTIEQYLKYRQAFEGLSILQPDSGRDKSLLEGEGHSGLGESENDAKAFNKARIDNLANFTAECSDTNMQVKATKVNNDRCPDSASDLPDTVLTSIIYEGKVQPATQRLLLETSSWTSKSDIAVEEKLERKRLKELKKQFKATKERHLRIKKFSQEAPDLPDHSITASSKHSQSSTLPFLQSQGLASESRIMTKNERETDKKFHTHHCKRRHRDGLGPQKEKLSNENSQETIPTVSSTKSADPISVISQSPCLEAVAPENAAKDRRIEKEKQRKERKEKRKELRAKSKEQNIYSFSKTDATAYVQSHNMEHKFGLSAATSQPGGVPIPAPAGYRSMWLNPHNPFTNTALGSSMPPDGISSPQFYEAYAAAAVAAATNPSRMGDLNSSKLAGLYGNVINQPYLGLRPPAMQPPYYSEFEQSRLYSDSTVLGHKASSRNIGLGVPGFDVFGNYRADTITTSVIPSPHYSPTGISTYNMLPGLSISANISSQPSTAMSMSLPLQEEIGSVVDSQLTFHRPLISKGLASVPTLSETGIFGNGPLSDFGGAIAPKNKFERKNSLKNVQCTNLTQSSNTNHGQQASILTEAPRAFEFSTVDAPPSVDIQRNALAGNELNATALISTMYSGDSQQNETKQISKSIDPSDLSNSNSAADVTRSPIDLSSVSLIQLPILNFASLNPLTSSATSKSQQNNISAHTTSLKFGTSAIDVDRRHHSSTIPVEQMLGNGNSRDDLDSVQIPIESSLDSPSNPILSLHTSPVVPVLTGLLSQGHIEGETADHHLSQCI